MTVTRSPLHGITRLRRSRGLAGSARAATVGTEYSAVVTGTGSAKPANRAHAHITEINAPHLSMITDAGVVASVIIQAAQATSWRQQLTRPGGRAVLRQRGPPALAAG
jgi:hypothetical protein